MSNALNRSLDALTAHLRALEEILLSPELRRDRARAGALLTADFLEFGSSGRIWSRTETLDLLATENYTPPAIEDFRCALLAADIALVTYRGVRAGAQGSHRGVTLRSSLWQKQEELWKIRFHQGTRVG